MSQSPSNSGDTGPSAPEDATYPPQLHAGAVGLGPEFGKGPTMSDKIDGLKEEIKGKIKHNPDLVQHGQDKRTGELKRKEMKESSGQAHPDEDKHQQEHANQERPDMKTVGHSEDK